MRVAPLLIALVLAVAVTAAVDNGATGAPRDGELAQQGRIDLASGPPAALHQALHPTASDGRLAGPLPWLNRGLWAESGRHVLLTLTQLVQAGAALLAGLLLVASRLLLRLQRHVLPRRSRLMYGIVVPGLAILLLGLLFLGQVTGPAIVFALLDLSILVMLGLCALAFFHQPHAASPSPLQAVLVVGAHPDDIELGASGFVMKLRADGARVYGIVMSQGERGVSNRPLRRLAEARKSARRLGLEGCFILDFPDTLLREHICGMKVAIEQKIEELGITLIVTHSAWETHGDHTAVFEAVKEAGRRCSIISFETVSTPQEFVPNFFVDITAYLSDKIKALEAHRSQREKSYMDPEMIRGRAAHRGLQAGVRFAEAFSVYRWVR